MSILESLTLNNYVNKTLVSEGNFQATNSQKSSRIVDYFDSIYSYPPKFKIKWDSIDELKGDLFLDYNYGVLEHSFPFLDVLEDWFFTETPDEAVTEKYTVKDYINGYVNKLNSSSYYLKKTQPLQEALSHVPIFVVQNGNGEIILNKPSKILNSSNIKSYFNEKLYDFCGAFDSQVEKKQNLGLFFLNKTDAETYLKAVAQSDIDGTKTVGLAINCISLDSAYKVTREHHPGVDFRFVPDLTELQTLLSKQISKADVILDDGQQQLRFRPRQFNLFPYLGKLGFFFSPTSSFLQRNEYFKGVPIYIVQVSSSPENFLFEKYFNFIGVLDTVYGRIIQSLDSRIGFGHNWIMQGSIQNANTSGKITNYVFFEKEQAAEFVKIQGRKVKRYSGSRTSNLEFFVRKPKIFISNLEDFLEAWEDNNGTGTSLDSTNPTSTIYNNPSLHFISPIKNRAEIFEAKQTYQTNIVQKIANSFDLKFRALKRNLGIFFSIY